MSAVEEGTNEEGDLLRWGARDKTIRKWLHQEQNDREENRRRACLSSAENCDTIFQNHRITCAKFKRTTHKQKRNTHK